MTFGIIVLSMMTHNIMTVRPGNPYWTERLSSVGIGYFVKKKNVVSVWKAADLNL
jgi:hypothetical protein